MLKESFVVMVLLNAMPVCRDESRLKSGSDFFPHASGIDFVHQEATLDLKIANVAPHVGALGACVSVSDVNNDGWDDLYFTSSRSGTSNALYLNQHDGTFRDVSTEAGAGALNHE